MVLNPLAYFSEAGQPASGEQPISLASLARLGVVGQPLWLRQDRLDGFSDRFDGIRSA